MSSVSYDADRELYDEDFKILSKKVIELFPSESIEVHYNSSIPANQSPDGKYKKAKGKLINKYNNLKKLYIPEVSNSAAIENTDVDHSDISFQNLDDIQESLNWLSDQEEPWDTTLRHWKLTFEYRQQVKDNSLDASKVASVYTNWPILKTPKGFTLINVDFELSQICKEKNPIENFDSVFEEILKVSDLRNKDDYCKVLYTSLSNTTLNENSRFFSKLAILCYVLPSYARILQSKRKYWKPSSLETLEGIVSHVDVSKSSNFSNFSDTLFKKNNFCIC